MGLPRLSLDIFSLFHFRAINDTQLTSAITAIIMPTIAPGERLREERELGTGVPVVIEVRLGIVAKVENDGSNEM